MTALTAEVPSGSRNAHLQPRKIVCTSAVTLGVLVFVLAAGCRTNKALRGSDLPPMVSEWIPFEQKNGLITLDVRINGTPARAMLDSGATGSMLGRKFFEKNNIKRFGGRVTASGAFGQKNMITAEDFKVDFVGERGARGRVSVQDAIVVDQPPGRVDLVLGLQFFRNLVVQIDYPKSRLRYMTRRATNLATRANTKVKKTRKYGHLLLRTKVNGKRRWVMLDTGNSGGIYLHRETARRQGWLRGARRARRKAVSGVTRKSSVEQWVLDRLTIGPHALRRVVLWVQSQSNASSNAPPRRPGSRIARVEDVVPGVLGYDVLRHFMVTVDYDAQLLHLMYQP